MRQKKRDEAKAEQAMTSERQNIMWHSHLPWIMSLCLNDFIHLLKMRGMNYTGNVGNDFND